MTTTFALLVIDMQLVAFDGIIIPPVTNGTRLLKSVSKLIRVCRQNGVHIVYVQTCAVSGEPYAKDVHGWQIHPKLAPQVADRVVYKRSSSGFDDTELSDVLAGLGVSALVTCGIWSGYCVANTSMDATGLGFQVFIAADAHGAVSNSKEEANEIIAEQNDRLSQRNISVLTVGELERNLQRHERLHQV